MKITIQRDELARALARAATPIQRKLSLPILGHVLVSADGDGVDFTGTDLDVTVTAHAPANVLRSGSVTLPADRMSRLVDLLPAGPVTIAEDKKAVVVTTGTHRSRLSVFPVDEFPTRPKPESSLATLSVALLRALAQRVVFCCIDEASRPVYMGVTCFSNDDGARFVASNGNSLVVELATDAPLSFANILPARGVQIAAKLLAGDEDIVLSADQDCVRLSQSAVSVDIRMVEGQHPDVDRFFALEFPAVLTVDVNAFEVVLKRLAIVLEQEQMSATFDFSLGNTQKAGAFDSDRGRVREELQAAWEGPDFRIALNIRQLTTIVSVLHRAGAETLRLSFGNGPEQPFKIEAFGDCELMPRLISMPMRAHLIDEDFAEEVRSA